jgi:hypothetical protein
MRCKNRPSTNRDLCVVVQDFVDRYPGNLYIEKGSRHWRVRCARSGDFIPISQSPSDVRAVKHLRCQLRRLAVTGRGLIAAKQH